MRSQLTVQTHTHCQTTRSNYCQPRVPLDNVDTVDNIENIESLVIQMVNNIFQSAASAHGTTDCGKWQMFGSSIRGALLCE